MNNFIEKKKIIGVTNSLLLNQADGFEIIVVDVEDADLDLPQKQITMIGLFDDIKINSQYIFYGNLFNNDKYGLVFQVEDFQDFKTNQTIDEIISAESQFDLDSQILETTSRTINKKTSELINNEEYDIFSKKLNSLGVQKTTIQSLYKQYGYLALDLLSDNPYIGLVENRLMTFDEADQLAAKLNFGINDRHRIQAAIIDALEQAIKLNGDTFLKRTQIFVYVLQLVDLDDESLIREFDPLLNELIDKEVIIENNDRFYFPEYYQAERTIANKLNILNHPIVAPAELDIVSENVLDEEQAAIIVEGYENNLLLVDSEFDEDKYQLIESILKTNQALVKTDSIPEKKIALIAPTRSAAKKLSQTIDYPVASFNNLIQNNSLDVDLLIINDSSMLNILQFSSLMVGFPDNAQLILIGDSNQMTSIGAGQIFLDLLDSQKIPTIKFENIEDQGDQKSTINKLADDIKNGILPADFTEKTNDHSFVKSSIGDTEQVLSKILKITKKSNVPLEEIQILVATENDPISIKEINNLSQSILNSSQKVHSFSSQQNFKMGDKVMQISNDNQRGISQGDQGIINSIIQDEDDQIEVSFDGRSYLYKNEQINQLSLAYATTVDMIQSNKYQVVILVLLNQNNSPWNKNLLYKAVTRTEKSLFMIGDYNAYQDAVQKTVKTRNSSINHLLIGDLQEEQSIFGDHFILDDSNELTINQVWSTNNLPELNAEIIDSGDIDPMIGMDGLAPEDFNFAND